MSDPGLVLEKDIMGTTVNVNKVYRLVISIVPILILSFDNCTMIRQSINIRGNWLEHIRELCNNSANSSVHPKLFFKNVKAKN